MADYYFFTLVKVKFLSHCVLTVCAIDCNFMKVILRKFHMQFYYFGVWKKKSHSVAIQESLWMLDFVKQ